jgi:hypothetical protein
VAREQPRPTAISWSALATALELGAGSEVPLSEGEGEVGANGEVLCNDVTVWSESVYSAKKEAIIARRNAVNTLNGNTGWVGATFQLGEFIR